MMEPEELAEKCLELRNRFYAYSNIAKRFIDFKANSKNIYQAAAYLVSNVTSHKGVAERQYWPVGDVITREAFEMRDR